MASICREMCFDRSTWAQKWPVFFSSLSLAYNCGGWISLRGTTDSGIVNKRWRPDGRISFDLEANSVVKVFSRRGSQDPYRRFYFPRLCKSFIVSRNSEKDVSIEAVEAKTVICCYCETRSGAKQSRPQWRQHAEITRLRDSKGSTIRVVQLAKRTRAHQFHQFGRP